MKFDTTAFKKASKRYADRHSLPLSEAQQAFAEVLGFKTTHNALKRLEAAPPADPGDACETPVAILPAQDSAFCCGLNMAEFKMLFECLFSKTGSRIDSANNAWSDQVRLLSRAVLGPIEFMGSAPMSVIELMNAFDMDAMDKNYVFTCSRHRSENMAVWPPLERPLARYMQSLHGYDTQRTSKRGGQTSDVRYHHLHFAAQLSRVFDLLLAIEAMGGACGCIDGYDERNMREVLKDMIETRVHPDQSKAAKNILRLSEMAEIYPRPQATTSSSIKTPPPIKTQPLATSLDT